MQVDQCGVTVDDNAGILQAKERDEQADTCGDCGLDRLGDGVEDNAAQAGDGQQDEDDAVNQNHDQRIGIGEAHTEADRVDKERVQTHAGGLCEGQIRQQSDQDGADHGGDCGSDVNRIVVAVTQRAEHTGVDHQDVSHCHECGNTGKNFCSYGCTMLFQSKELFHEIPPLFIPPLIASVFLPENDIRPFCAPA